MTDIATAAKEVIRSLGVPPGAHNVVIKSEVVDGKVRQYIAVAIRPGHEANADVPTKWGEHEVRQRAWPRGS